MVTFPIGLSVIDLGLRPFGSHLVNDEPNSYQANTIFDAVPYGAPGTYRIDLNLDIVSPIGSIPASTSARSLRELCGNVLLLAESNKPPSETFESSRLRLVAIGISLTDVVGSMQHREGEVHPHALRDLMAWGSLNFLIGEKANSENRLPLINALMRAEGGDSATHRHDFALTVGVLLTACLGIQEGCQDWFEKIFDNTGTGGDLLEFARWFIACFDRLNARLGYNKFGGLESSLEASFIRACGIDAGLTVA